MRALLVERFKRKQGPVRALNMGLAHKIFQSCGKPYAEGGGYSFNYYGPENWMDVIKWLLDHGYNEEETEQVLRSKLMRWASDNSDHDNGNCTLEDFIKYNNKYLSKTRKKNEVDQFLDEYYPDPTRSQRIKKDIKENMGGVGAPMSTLSNTPGMGNAVPAQQAATTATQFNSPKSTGSGDKWGSINKKPYTQSNLKKKKSKKVKIVKEKL